MQDLLEQPIVGTPPSEKDIEQSYRIIGSLGAAARLNEARKQLIRVSPALAEHVMHVQIMDAQRAVRFCEAFPKSVFVTDGEDLAYSGEWIVGLSQVELLFVWAQLAYKYQQGWGPDLRLKGRFPHWQGFAFDAVANAWLVREGIGVAPQGAIFFEGIHADTDTDDAYDLICRYHEEAATEVDEVGRSHLNHAEVVAMQEETSDGHAPLLLNGTSLLDLIPA